MKITTKITYLDNLLLGILAGVSIAIGGMFNIMCLSIGQKLFGSVAFSIGLIMVCFFGLHLFTGKIGYLRDNKPKFIISLVIMYIGNLIGAIGFGYILRACGFASGSFANSVTSVSSKKLIDLGSGVGQNWLTMLALGFLCCNMVFLAVDIYKKNKNWFIKIISIVICVAFFVYTGMEHCVADMFYLAVGNQFATNLVPAILGIVVSTVGNALGALVLHDVVYYSSLKDFI